MARTTTDRATVIDGALPADTYAQLLAEIGSSGEDEIELETPTQIRAALCLDQLVAVQFGRLERHSAVVVTILKTSSNSIHQDRDRVLGLLYLCKDWDLSKGGELLIVKPDRITIHQAIEYRPNRAVVLDGHLPHVVRPPTPNTDIPRRTLVVRYHRAIQLD